MSEELGISAEDYVMEGEAEEDEGEEEEGE